MRVVSSARSVGAEGAVFLLHDCVMVSVEFEAVRPCSGMLRVMLYSMRCLLHTGIPAREGGVSRMIDSFMLSVLAGIVCHYLCKWLDG